MKRFAPHQFKNEIKWNEAWKPLVIIPVEVYKDIHCIVEAAKTEVTWIGTIKQLDEQKYYLQEVFLTEQVGSPAHSKLTAQGLGQWTREIVIERPDESEWIINNFRFYGHSHPGMSTSPSSQDNDEFNNIVKDTKDYFVRCICNKDGRMEMSVIFFAQKLKITDVAWELHIPIEEERKKKWRQEVKEKVQVRHNYGYHYQQPYNHHGYQSAYETPPRYAARIPGYHETLNQTAANELRPQW